MINFHRRPIGDVTTPPSPPQTPQKHRSSASSARHSKCSSPRPHRLPALTIEEYESQFRNSASDLDLIERVFRGGLANNQMRAALWPYLFGLIEKRGRFRPKADQTSSLTQSAYSKHSSSNSISIATHNNICTNSNNNSLNHRNAHNSNNNNNNHSSSNSYPHTHSYANGKYIDTLKHKNNSNNNNTKYAYNHHMTSLTRTNSEELTNNDRLSSYEYVEHQDNKRRWEELERLYRTYESQWKLILPEQEQRFTTFREHKSLIERDVIRSDRSHPFYADDSHNLALLTNLLMTYMMYDFDIGYLQGMSDLAAPILYVFNGDLVKSFWVFVEVMKLCRRNFEFTQNTIHIQLSCLYKLLKQTDPRLAQYLYENDCSNCFFAFRCIVCQFKRELMKNSDRDDDYAYVLRLWDTIWLVQRRHDLLSRNKYSNGYTNGYTNGFIAGRTSPCNANGYISTPPSPSASSTLSSASAEASPTALEPARSRPFKAASRPIEINGTSHHNNHHNHHHHNHHATSDDSKSKLLHNGHSSVAASKIKSMRSAVSNKSHNGHGPVQSELYQHVVDRKTTDTRNNGAPAYWSSSKNCIQLTETEKFVMSLCLSLIQRERNKIMDQCLDASGIHQLFINPPLAKNLDAFIEDSYQIYQYLNTECDLDALVRNSTQNGGNSSNGVRQNGASRAANSAYGDDDLIDGELDDELDGSSADEGANSYDLLRDYLIISPTPYSASVCHAHGHSSCVHMYGCSQNSYVSRYSVSQKSWDHFLNNAPPLADEF